jgi:glycosyltransferase involved in cell wall biosynthesis
MRILYASERPPYPFFLGGAARCAHKLLRSLAGDLGVDCAAVGSSDYTTTPWAFPSDSEFATLEIRSAQYDGRRGSIDCGYPVRVFRDFWNALGRFVDDYKPDVIWSQLEGARSVLEIGKAKGIRGLIYVHDAEFDADELRAIANLGCQVVCNSAFIAEKARRAIGRTAHVVYPAMELYFGTERDPGGCVTMINPHRVKGIDTFFAIAGRMPAQRFLLVESWRLNEADLAALQARLAEAPNVRFTSRFRHAFDLSRAKLLLVPSVWEEGFGMVAVEAQSCGIPVIASARGGLGESVGDGGVMIDDYRNADAWVEAVNRVLSDGAVYDDWSRRALRHANSSDFAVTPLARRFLAVCSAPAPRTGVHARVLNAARNRLRKSRCSTGSCVGRWARAPFKYETAHSASKCASPTQHRHSLGGARCGRRIRDRPPSRMAQPHARDRRGDRARHLRRLGVAHATHHRTAELGGGAAERIARPLRDEPPHHAQLFRNLEKDARRCHQGLLRAGRPRRRQARCGVGRCRQ